MEGREAGRRRGLRAGWVEPEGTREVWEVGLGVGPEDWTAELCISKGPEFEGGVEGGWNLRGPKGRVSGRLVAVEPEVQPKGNSCVVLRLGLNVGRA